VAHPNNAVVRASVVLISLAGLMRVMTDKGELLRSFLEERGVQLPSRQGWTKISCFNDAAHPRGDRNPSASVNLDKGRYRCFACGIEGDAYDLLQQLEGLTFAQARTILGGTAHRVVEETWL
jgi:hypothetical protein